MSRNSPDKHFTVNKYNNDYNCSTKITTDRLNTVTVISSTICSS